jgi:peptide-methionine (S)-S-oxide reductase
MPRSQRLILLSALVLALGYAWLRGAFIPVSAASAVGEPPIPASAAIATFAAGCFWSAEAVFEGMPGVLSVVSGYTGGTTADPTYAQVSSGATGHAEAVEIRFDPGAVTYAELLDRFWHHVDLFAAHQQFCDLGDQYRPAVFVHDAAQREAAAASRERWHEHFGQPVRVEVTDASGFYRAEPYHQNYAARHPLQYRFYRWSCGRDARLRHIWEHPPNSHVETFSVLPGPNL